MKDYLELRKEELKKRGNKGFTLMEMLIVVAIIAVLIAIAIPVFTSQLENSREAADAANLRSAYAEVAAKYLTDGASGASNSKTVTAAQMQDSWQNDTIKNGNIGDIPVSSSVSAKVNGNSWVVSCDGSGTVTIN